MQSLKRFFVLNPTLIKGDSAEARAKAIVYFYPEDTPLDKQIQLVGFSCAIIQFTRTFSSEMESLMTKNGLHVYYEPERDFWFVMVVEPVKPGKSAGTNVRDEETTDQLSPLLCQDMLRQIYSQFKMMHSTCTAIMKEHGISVLRTLLSARMPRLVSLFDLNSIHVADACPGVRYLPVDKNMFLDVQCCMDRLQTDFPVIKKTCFFYCHHVLWSGMQQADLSILNRHLLGLYNHLGATSPNVPEAERRGWSDTGVWLMGGSSAAVLTKDDYIMPKEVKQSPVAAHDDDERSRQSPLDDKAWLIPQLHKQLTTARVDVPGAAHFPFLTQDPNYKFSVDNAVPVYLSSGTSGVLAFALDKIVLVMVVDQADKSVNSTAELEIYLRKQLKPMVDVLMEKFTYFVSAEEYRYLYINNMNMAIKSSLDLKGTLAADVLPTIDQIHQEFYSGTSNLTEISVKTNLDWWVIGKRCAAREFYFVFDTKNANLIEIDDEVEKLIASRFNNIYIM